MKKILLILLYLPIIGFGQSQEIIWEQNLDSSFNLASLSNNDYNDRIYGRVVSTLQENGKRNIF